jgi:hypothetical protein
VYSYWLEGSASLAINELPPADVLRALLAALDDPERFAAAHDLLRLKAGQWDEPRWGYDYDSDPPVSVLGPLRVELRAEGATRDQILVLL